MPDETTRQGEMTINEEANLPANWVPLDVPPIVPSGSPYPSHPSAVSSSVPGFLQATLPPGVQQNTDYVRAGQHGPNMPTLSLMPLSPSGQASVGAATQSGLEKNPSFLGVQSQTQQNTTGLQQATALPGNVTNLSTVQWLAKDITANLRQIVEVSFTAPNDGIWESVRIWATNYPKFGAQPVVIGVGISSPVSLNLSGTGNSTILTAQSVSKQGVVSTFS